VPEYKRKSNYLGILIYIDRSMNVLVMNSEAEGEEKKDQIHSLEDEEEDDSEDDEDQDDDN
jgi:hypothetical protein